MTALAQQHNLVVRAAATVAAPVPPPLAPSLPEPSVVQKRWQTAVGNAPSAPYRSTFAFPQPPFAALAALARNTGDGWKARHGSVAVGDLNPPQRSTPRVLGQEQGVLPRPRAAAAGGQRTARQACSPTRTCRAMARPLTACGPRTLRALRPLRPDRHEPAGPSAAAAAGAAPALRARRPRRPAVRRPAVAGRRAADLRRAPARPSDRFADADEPRLASVIVVPRIDDLAAGSQAVAQVTVQLDDIQQIDLSAPGFTDVAFTLPVIDEQQPLSLTLSAHYTYTDDIVSRDATALVEVTDMRVPAVYPTGLGLFWTSAPGSDPEVELRLSWSAPDGSLHRVYATRRAGAWRHPRSARRGNPRGAAIARARREVGGNKVLGGATIERRGFRLVTPTPITAAVQSNTLDAHIHTHTHTHTDTHTHTHTHTQPPSPIASPSTRCLDALCGCRPESIPALAGRGFEQRG